MKRIKAVLVKVGLLILVVFLGMLVVHRAEDRDLVLDDPYAKINDLEDLEPQTQELAAAFLNRCHEEGLPVVITETYRTQERQDQLYEQGRSQEGPVVTWTRKSLHTERRAFDICKAGPDPYGDDEFFRRCADIGLELGLTAGYYFEKYQDKPHFQLDKWWEER